MAARNQFQQKVNYLRQLEKKFRSFLLNGENKKAIDLLLQIIEGYNSIGAQETVRNLKSELKILLKRFNLSFTMPEESEDHERADPKEVLKFISALEKKVRRRLLQGKVNEAIRDLKYIITELRELRHDEKADLLENTLNQYILELSGEALAQTPSKPAQPKLKPIRLPSPIKPFTKTSAPAQPPQTSPSQLTPPIEIETPSKPLRAIPPPPMPSSQVSTIPPISPTIPHPPKPPSLMAESPQTKNQVLTIKDEPLSEEEMIVEKLFEIKDMFSKKSS